MPSSHSAIVACLSTMIAKEEGITSTAFAISVIFSIIVMCDAVGVRNTVGKQSKVLNNILKDHKKSNFEKLQEMTGHTPFQVVTGVVIGIIVGFIF